MTRGEKAARARLHKGIKRVEASFERALTRAIKVAEGQTRACLWCGREVRSVGRGRPAQYCTEECRRAGRRTYNTTYQAKLRALHEERGGEA
jgi:hypothetical protein